MTWYRVFCASEELPASAEWAGAGGRAWEIHRYTADEDGIRAELNSWAALLETREDDPACRALMERLIQARQLFYFEQPSEEAGEECVSLCRRLAATADGFYHIDDEGFFAADGTLLIGDA